MKTLQARIVKAVQRPEPLSVCVTLSFSLFVGQVKSPSHSNVKKVFIAPKALIDSGSQVTDGPRLGYLLSCPGLLKSVKDNVY